MSDEVSVVFEEIEIEDIHGKECAEEQAYKNPYDRIEGKGCETEKCEEKAVEANVEDSDDVCHPMRPSLLGKDSGHCCGTE